jgi:iron complex outermembrane receptor protein
MKKNYRRCLLVTYLLIAKTALGQSASVSPAVSDPNVASGADQLEEIVVTALRRSEDVQHAAVAVDVISPSALALMGATRATDIATLVPALQISESGNSQQSLYLRSVGTFSANSYSDPAVAFNVDGIAIGRPSSMTGVLYDLDRIEVLKGPQGTLYGRNATGGAINVQPNLPKLGVTSVDTGLSVGNFGEVHPEAALNLPIGESSAARLALTYSRHSAYQSDGSGSANDYAGRGQYLVQPNDDLSIRVAVDFAHDGGSGSEGTLVALQNPFTGVFTPSELGRDVGNQDPRVGALLGRQYSFISGRFLEPIQGDPNTNNRFWGAMSEVDWHTPIGTLTFLPAYRKSKLEDLTTSFSFGSIVDENDSQTSLEVRLASENKGLIRWLVGGYYFHESIDAIYQFNLEALSPIQDLNTGTLSKATFARLTFAPIDQFRISTGIRFTDDRKSFDGAAPVLLSVCGTTTPIPACPAAPLIPPATSIGSIISQLQLFPIIPNALYGSALPGAHGSVFPYVNIPIDQSTDFTRVTWHAGLEYDLAPDSLLYASWDSGYHAGGFAFATIKPTYAPEFISAYSVGSKNRFLNNRLQANFELFYWKYTNQQIPHSGTDPDGTAVFYTDNAGSSTIKGLEASAKYLVTSHTVLSLDAQYLSAIYDNFLYQTPAGGTNAPPVTGCPFVQSDATHYTVNCAGKTAQHSPKWTGNVGIQQTVDVGAYALVGDLNAHAQSQNMTGFEMIQSEVQKSYTETNASLALMQGNDHHWSVTAFVNNIEDKRPYGSTYYNGTMGTVGATVGPPRTFGVRGRYAF